MEWLVKRDNTIEHHGIDGMHWGVRNGPPYPLSQEKHAKVVRSAKKEESKTSKASDKSSRNSSIDESAYSGLQNEYNDAMNEMADLERQYSVLANQKKVDHKKLSDLESQIEFNEIRMMEIHDEIFEPDEQGDMFPHYDQLSDLQLRKVLDFPYYSESINTFVALQKDIERVSGDWYNGELKSKAFTEAYKKKDEQGMISAAIKDLGLDDSIEMRELVKECIFWD